MATTRSCDAVDFDVIDFDAEFGVFTEIIGGVSIQDSVDPHGGTVREITSENIISLGTKTITENGTYIAQVDGLTGYSVITVNVGENASPEDDSSQVGGT